MMTRAHDDESTRHHVRPPASPVGDPNEPPGAKAREIPKSAQCSTSGRRAARRERGSEQTYASGRGRGAGSAGSGRRPRSTSQLLLLLLVQGRGRLRASSRCAPVRRIPPARTCARPPPVRARLPRCSGHPSDPLRGSGRCRWVHRATDVASPVRVSGGGPAPALLLLVSPDDTLRKRLSPAHRPPRLPRGGSSVVVRGCVLHVRHEMLVWPCSRRVCMCGEGEGGWVGMREGGQERRERQREWHRERRRCGWAGPARDKDMSTRVRLCATSRVWRA